MATRKYSTDFLALMLGLTLLACSGGLLAQAKDATRSEPMTFSAFRPCGGNAGFCAPRILARGRIVESTPAAFVNFLRNRHLHRHELPPVTTIVFDSAGGDVGSAVKLGKLIRAARLESEVAKSYEEERGTEQFTLVSDAICASACVLAFAGGITRRAESDGVLGVHQFFGRDRDIGQSAAQVTVVVLAEHLEMMGVKRELLDVASLVPPQKMRFLSRKEAASLNLDNNAPRQSAWRLSAMPDGRVAGHTEHFTPAHGATTALALFRQGEHTWLAVSVGFAATAYGNSADAIDALQGSSLSLELAGVGTQQFSALRWSLQRQWVSTYVKLSQRLVLQMATSPSLTITSDTGQAAMHLAPNATFELNSLSAFIPAIVRE